MTSFFEAKFTSRPDASKPLKSHTQTYKATGLDDAMQQHDRTSNIMRTVHPEYECNLVTISEVVSKSKIKRLTAGWDRLKNQ